jgi:hypothetical protein
LTVITVRAGCAWAAIYGMHVLSMLPGTTITARRTTRITGGMVFFANSVVVLQRSTVDSRSRIATGTTASTLAAVRVNLSHGQEVRIVDLNYAARSASATGPTSASAACEVAQRWQRLLWPRLIRTITACLPVHAILPVSMDHTTVVQVECVDENAPTATPAITSVTAVPAIRVFLAFGSGRPPCAATTSSPTAAIPTIPVLHTSGSTSHLPTLPEKGTGAPTRIMAGPTSSTAPTGTTGRSISDRPVVLECLTHAEGVPCGIKRYTHSDREISVIHVAGKRRVRRDCRVAVTPVAVTRVCRGKVARIPSCGPRGHSYQWDGPG